MVRVVATVTFAGRTSMEVEVLVYALNLHTGDERQTNSCFVTMVALDDEGRPRSLDYSRLMPVAIEAIKAQQATIDEQRTEIERQRERLDALERAVAELLQKTE